MFLLCKLIKWGQGGGWGQRWGKDDFPSVSSVLFVAPSGSLLLGWLTDWLMLLMASALLQVQLPGPTTGCHEPPSLPASDYGWKPILSPSPPGFPPLCLALCYDPGFPSTHAHFLTSAEGNASCLATLILFSWWSALISLPQLVSGPESKWTEKGKWFRTILGSYDMLNQCFFPCDRRYLKNDIEHACQDCGCLPHSAARCSTRHLHTD